MASSRTIAEVIARITRSPQTAAITPLPAPPYNSSIRKPKSEGNIERVGPTSSVGDEGRPSSSRAIVQTQPRDPSRSTERINHTHVVHEEEPLMRGDEVDAFHEEGSLPPATAAVSHPGGIPPASIPVSNRDLSPRGCSSDTRAKVALAVESMREHMTDEGWQIMAGLREGGGYLLAGYNLTTESYREYHPVRKYTDLVDVAKIIKSLDPGVVLLQDKREWDLEGSKDFREPKAKFFNVEELTKRSDIFKLTILKDSHARPEYHRKSAEEIGCHAWVVYYAPEIVRYLAPYLRKEHLIRTYHSLNKDLVPQYTEIGRRGCLLSGAVSNVYPLRRSLVNGIKSLPDTTYLQHPGYHRNGCATPKFLKILSGCKVAICTSSIYGYALRKIIEATACGCTVITDLPRDEILPWIDDNLIRLPDNATPQLVAQVLKTAYANYNPKRQRVFSESAKSWYDYRAVGRRLSIDIDTMRANYSCK